MPLLTGQLASRFMRINRGRRRQGRREPRQHGQCLRIRMNSSRDRDARHALGRASGLKFMRIDSVGRPLRPVRSAGNPALARSREQLRLAQKANRPHGLAPGGLFMRINGFSHVDQAFRQPVIFPALAAAPPPRYRAGFQARSQTPGVCRQARQSTLRRHRRAACNSRWNI